MNGGILIAHMLVLVFYLVSIIIYNVAFYYVNKYPDSYRLAIFGLRAWDVSTIVNFLS